MEKNSKYLSFRIQIWEVVIGGLFSVLWLLAVYDSVTGKVDSAVFFVLGACFLISLVWMVFYILIPYKKVDRQMRLFLAGYSAAGLKNSDCMLSPATDQLVLTVLHLLESDKMLNANKRQAQYLAL